MILEINKIKLCFLKDEKDILIDELRKNNLVMIKDIDQNIYLDQHSDIDKAIQVLNQYSKDNSNICELNIEKFQKINKENQELINYILNIDNQLQDINKKINSINEKITLYSKFKYLSIKNSQIKNKILKFKTIRLNEKFEKIKIFNDELTRNNLDFETNNDLNNYFVTIAYLNFQEDLIDSLLKNYKIENIDLPITIQTFSYELKSLSNLQSELTSKKNTLIETLTKLSKKLNDLKIFYDQKANETIKEKICFQETKYLSFIEGYVKKIDYDLLINNLNKSLTTFYIEVIDTIEEKERKDDNIRIEVESSFEKINELNDKITKTIEDLNIYKQFDYLSLNYSQLTNSKIKFITIEVKNLNKKTKKNFICFLIENKYIFEENNKLELILTIALTKQNEKLLKDYLLNFEFKELVLPEITSTYRMMCNEIKNQLSNLEKEKEEYLKTIETKKLDLLDNINEEVFPTALTNKKIVKSHEIITNMFSVPRYDEIDPTPSLTIWYWIIFGLMMGDFGYGLLMILISYLILKIKKPKGSMEQLLRIFMFAGISTIIFGILMGSFFGITVNLLGLINDNWSSILLQPLNKPLQMLVFTLFIGFLHIIHGIILKIIICFKFKKYYEAISDGFSWISILIGILFIVLKLNLLGYTLIITGIMLIMIYKGKNEKNIFKKFFKGLGELYGITNFMSDILSYSRILALALSSSVIAYTMNLLANMVSGGFGWIISIIIFIIGHAFNISIGLLSTYVHDGRLQYLEFFGKFYTGGGYEFEPFSYKLKYINKIMEEK